MNHEFYEVYYVNSTIGYIIYIILIILFIILLVCLTVSFSSQNSNQTEQITQQAFDFPILIINLDRKPERLAYVTNQLNTMGLSGYKKLSGTDGFKESREDLTKFGLTYELTERPGIAGCAASHVRAWEHIRNNKMGWTLILEDDAHFHPQFMQLFSKYWEHVPKDAKIVFPGFCAESSVEQTHELVIKKEVMCLQGYMLSWEGAQYLLDNLLPLSQPVDIAIDNHFKHIDGSYIFNGNVIIDGIRPNDYKEANGRRCMFNGIIYQNHEEQGSTIHSEETVF